MSGSTGGRGTRPAPAPWRAAFLEHLSKVDSPVFVLSTLHSAHAKGKAGSPAHYSPRARYCVFRALWGEQNVDERNPAPRNEKVYESELITITTDVRMEKVPEIFASAPGGSNEKDSWKGSGGGGPVEAVWWIKETMTEWRIRGPAYVVAPDIDEEGEGARAVKSALKPRMRVIKGQEGKEGDWSWSRELTTQFGNMSPAMRGQFRNPPPGQDVSSPPSEGLGLGQKVDDIYDEIARSNFRVLIINPEVVEQVDLSDPDRGRRWVYILVNEDGNEAGDWEVEEVWP